MTEAFVDPEQFLRRAVRAFRGSTLMIHSRLITFRCSHTTYHTVGIYSILRGMHLLYVPYLLCI